MEQTDKISLDSPISELPLVGTALTKAFHTARVFTVADLLYHFPTRYIDYRKTVGIGSVEEGEVVTVIGKIKSVRASFFGRRMPYAEVVLEDGSGKIRAVWFNQTYIAKQLETGMDVILSGKVTRFKQLQFTNPAYDIIDPEFALGTNLHTGRLVPVYKRADLVPLRTMRKLVKSTLNFASELDDFIPQRIAKTGKILPIADAVRLLHFPENQEDVDTARFRIAVDDILPQQLAIELKKDVYDRENNFPVQADIEAVKHFLTTLPFALTPSQKRATWDIFQDIAAGKPMNRLLQGDVGSGKTIVAVLAAMQFAKDKLQTAVLAPTEILAKQHYETFRSLLGNQPQCKIALLTRTFAIVDDVAVSKAEIHALLSSGKITICIGTHALLQGKIDFKQLALVVIDEQHRFGVAQRSFLLTEHAHLLSMSATPIPRTLAMSLYADLDVSTLSHVPNGRKPVITTVVPESERNHAYTFINEEVRKGRQAFIVTPRVEDSDTSDVRSVKKEFARLQNDVFPKLRLGLLYGKMKGADKDEVMARFANGELDILVATSVIEIGIDIPKATAIIIEGSERFGLAQLHQLRGRVGRNEFQSRCFLFTTEDSHQETARLNALTNTNDGFALAELDLAQRGFGDLFGKQQSGFMFRFPQFITVKALKTARNIAVEIHKSSSKTLRISKLYNIAQKYLDDIHAE